MGRIRKIAFQTGKILQYNLWNLDAEAGDKMIYYERDVYRLEQRGVDTELYPRKINPPDKQAVKINNVWYWQKTTNKTLEPTDTDGSAYTFEK